MGGEEGPGVAGCPRGRGDVPQAPEERRAVFGIRDDRPPLDPPEDHMVQRARRRFRTKDGRASRRACRGIGDRLLLPNG